MPSTVTIDSNEVRRALRAISEMADGSRLTQRLVGEATDMAAAVEARAAALAPVAEGTLRGSATSSAQLTGAKLTATVEFGGQASNYASLQHEETTWQHTLPPGMSRTHTKAGKPRKRQIKGYRGGQAHFLYGRQPDGAWEQMSAGAIRMLDGAVGRICEEELAKP